MLPVLAEASRFSEASGFFFVLVLWLRGFFLLQRCSTSSECRELAANELRQLSTTSLLPRIYVMSLSAAIR